MSTLRISNIEAKSVPASATIDEKVKITNSSGDTLVFIDGKTSGITTVGINTTDSNITFDANSNVVVTGIITATRFSGQITPTSLEIGSNIKLGNAGVITATSFEGAIQATTGTFSDNLNIVDAIRHSGDTDTKIRFPSADTISFETGGSERLRITSDGDVGISSDAPRAKLDVKDLGTSKDVILRVSADNNTPYGLVVGNDTFNTTSNRGLALWVGGTTVHHLQARTSTTASENKLEIEAYETKIQTGSSLNKNFTFDSSGRLLTYGTLSEGNLPLGGNVANAAIQIRCDDKYKGIAFGEGFVSGSIGLGGADSTTALVYTANAAPANLGGGTKITHEWHSGTAGGGGPGRFMALDTDGDLTLDYGSLKVANGQGIDFSAAGNTGGMTSELLDDYEEGSWTPSMNKSGATGSADSQVTNRFGYYIKVGNMLWLSFYWYSNNLSFGTGGNAWYIDNLPFNLLTLQSSAYQFISGGYLYTNTHPSAYSAGYRWQSNGTNGPDTLMMYGTNNTTNASGGAWEFSGCGTLRVS